MELAEKTVKEGLTVRQLEQLVAQINGKKPKKAKKQTNPYEPYIKQTENLLQEKFRTKVAVKANAKSGKGKIEIEEQFFESEREIHLYAMGRAYDMKEKNECFSSLEFIGC